MQQSRRSPRCVQLLDHGTVPSSAGPSSSLVISRAIAPACVGCGGEEFLARPRRWRRSRSSCRRRRGRRAGRRGAWARRGRWSTAPAGRSAPRRCGRRRPASARGRVPPAHRPQVVTRNSSGPLSIVSQAKPSAASRCAEQGLAAGVVGGDGAAGDQLLGQVQRRAHRGRRPKFERRGPGDSSGSQSSVISVKVAGRLPRAAAGATFDAGCVVLQPPQQVGRRVGVGQAFVARDRAFGDQPGEVVLEGLRAFGQRLSPSLP